jgi:hypothetical protein
MAGGIFIPIFMKERTEKDEKIIYQPAYEGQNR